MTTDPPALVRRWPRDPIDGQITALAEFTEAVADTLAVRLTESASSQGGSCDGQYLKSS
jgi:hypothetical protein